MRSVALFSAGPDECDKATADLKAKFATSIVTTDRMTLEGRIRPAPNKGHEHFGFKDGVSQPALRLVGIPLLILPASITVIFTVAS